MPNAKPMVAVSKDELLGLLKSAHAKEPSGVEKFVLWATKWSPSQLQKISDVIGTVQGILSAFGTVGAAFSTATALLEMVGILDAKDPFADLRKQIDGLKTELREGIDKIEEHFRLDRRLDWSKAMDRADTALKNFANSPGASDNQEKLRDALTLVGDALFQMLHVQYVDEFGTEIPAAGDIAFNQKGYGWPPANYADPPAHWVPYAHSPIMIRATSDPAQRPINFLEVDWSAPPDERYNKQDLKARIWDPSYYLDLVTTGVSYYVALLAVVEPAYRGTAHNRSEIIKLAASLKKFVTTWRNSLLITNVDFFLSPVAYLDRTHVWHPYGNPNLPETARGIPLGVADPISGLMYFHSVWSEGFEFEAGVFSNFAPSRSRMIVNTSAAAAIAHKAIASGLAAIEASCGIAALSGVQKRLEELAEYGLYGSLYSKPQRVQKLPFSGKLTDPFAPILASAPETISLGEIGVKAGKPGKLYEARRYFDTNGKSFRLPIVRRMFVSEIQLGYRMVFAVSGFTKTHSVTLTKFNSPGHPGHNEEFLPEAPEPFEFIVDDATVYDVVQSVHFTAKDEEHFEEGQYDFDRQRLFLNPRTGRVAVRIDIEFELDLEDPNVPYIAYANVGIQNLDETPNESFILHVAAYEEANTSGGSYLSAVDAQAAIDSTEGEPVLTDGLIQERKEISAGDITVHFVPSYLIPESAFFEDRAIGLAVIDKSILEIMQVPDIGLKPWRTGGDPKWRNHDLATQTEVSLGTLERLSRQYPGRAAAVIAQLQPPSIIERSPK